MTRKPERIDVFKLTQDDWYPAYQLAGWFRGKKGTRLVTVSFIEMINGGGWRVCVWGGDDYGLERDLDDWGEAIELFDEVIRQEFVNQQWLRDQGFQHA